MTTLIRDRAIARCDHWRLPDPSPVNPLALDDHVIVPKAFWLAHREALRARAGSIGVALEGGDDPADLRDDVGVLGLIAVRFVSFGDGRPFSIARLLRDRLGFAGELRAVGHVQRDQLAFMERCGFNAFELRAGEDAATALSAFDEITRSYQETPARPNVPCVPAERPS